MDDKKGQTIFLSVIGVATLLVAIVGATFAYFTASVTGNESASSIIVNTAVIASIEFTDYNNNVLLDNALPGASATKTFTVALAGDATTTVAMSYNVRLVYSGSAGEGGSLITDLTYTLSCDGTATECSASDDANTGTGVRGNIGNAGVAAPGLFIGSGTFAAGTTNRDHVWTFTITFPETGLNQNSQQGADFEGKIQVEFAGGDDAIYYNSANPGGTTTEP